MAESKDSTSLDSARLVLTRTLLFESGKALFRFSSVIDSVRLLSLATKRSFFRKLVLCK